MCSVWNANKISTVCSVWNANKMSTVCSVWNANKISTDNQKIKQGKIQNGRLILINC